MTRLALALFLAAVPAGASAQNMNAEQFHQRAQALKAKGAMALFSRGEINALTAEGQAAGKAAREQRLAAVRAGKSPRYCPPEGQNKMGSDEFMSRLAAIPQQERQKIDMVEATNRMLAAKFPCPAA